MKIKLICLCLLLILIPVNNLMADTAIDILAKKIVRDRESNDTKIFNDKNEDITVDLGVQKVNIEILPNDVLISLIIYQLNIRDKFRNKIFKIILLLLEFTNKL